MNTPVTKEQWAELRRESMQAFPALLEGKELPEILLPYQRERLQATAAHQLVADEKSRRIGATWGIASDAVLTSGAQKSAGGMDTIYIGYNLDMAREFIDACAMWARRFLPAASEVSEYLFVEQDEKGADRAIQALRINFASGFEIKALSARPRSLRGQQGFVILDEFAFHDDAAALLKAAMALLIWGGRVLVISTHNGEDNPFNELIIEIRSGKRKGKVVRTTFDDALQQGLYRRVCLMAGQAWSPEAEGDWRESIRSYYGADAAEELDCIPSQGSGVYLTSAVIEACMSKLTPVLRLTCPPGFELQSDESRRSYVDDWIEEHLKAVLNGLNERRRHSYGFDFGRSGDLSVLTPLEEQPNLSLHAPFVLELRNVPFRQQEQVLFHIVDRLPRFGAGKHDARGNGQFLAEVAMQRYGALRVEPVMLSQGWYLENMPVMKAAFEDRSIELPADADVKSDLRQIKMVRGIPMVPNDAQTRGLDGGQRHGDAAVSVCLAVAAAKSDAMDFGYEASQSKQPPPPPRGLNRPFYDEPEHDDETRDWWKPPAGSGLRGSV